MDTPNRVPNKYKGKAYEILRKKYPIPGDWIAEMDCFGVQVMDYEISAKLAIWAIVMVTSKKTKLTRTYYNPVSDYAVWELKEIASQSAMYAKARMTTPKTGDCLLSPDSNHHYASLEFIDKVGVYGVGWVRAVMDTNDTKFVRVSHNAKSDFAMWKVAYLN